MTNMKRCLSDSEAEDFDDLKDGSPSQSCHQSDRKKRRGVIEKRRRDRINSSLSELRRLVPAAFEKQGSAKLEKAEILQMTVDHLKMLHSKGLNGYNLDTAALAMDYRSVGYRECAAEVARYLVAVEGIDIQDPLRLRLLSHLQCYSAQREAATKARFQNSSWNTMAAPHALHSQYNASGMSTMTSGMISQHASTQDQLSMTSHTGLSTHAGLSSAPYSESSRLSQHESSHMSSSMAGSMRTGVTSQMPSVTSSAASQVTSSVLSGLPQVHTQFPVSLGMNSVPMLSPTAHYNTTSSSSSALSQAVKPYRPWGGELVY